MKAYIEYGLSKKGAQETYPFGDDVLVIKVSSKMFALFGVKENVGTVSLKCEPEVAELLRMQYPAVTPGYHLNKRHWNTILLDGSIPKEEVLSMIDDSYRLVYKSLTKAEKETLE
ncbi:MmcQ/YjbR family DNA-binding protein [Brevibacillus ginsengisoli]|uniref:MmcQ/YjbR family DNA-binding protein n=1 Tax=Brevibacillus ginsengisoli TaxID=363854 RepID=UPI003CF4A293